MIWILIIALAIALIVWFVYLKWKRSELKIETTQYGTPILRADIMNNTMELLLDDDIPQGNENKEQPKKSYRAKEKSKVTLSPQTHEDLV